MEYQVIKMGTNEKELAEVQQLLHLTFPNRKEKFSITYLYWQYVANPMGSVVAFNAYTEKNEIAAHYATIPVKMRINGMLRTGLLSLNTATHPDHRGKRLFSILANKTYQYAAEKGYKFVIGVANANSTHGFLKNLGFYLVAPLEVKIGIGDAFANDIPENKNMIKYDISAIKWRLQCPQFSYSCKGRTIYGKINKPFFHTAVAQMPDGITKEELGLSTTFDIFNLYIGLGVKPKGLYFCLPKFIKRSPFNLIFKDLTKGELPKITKDNIVFQLIDYDVA